MILSLFGKTVSKVNYLVIGCAIIVKCPYQEMRIMANAYLVLLIFVKIYILKKLPQDSEGNVCILFQPENHLSVFSQDWLRKNCYDLNNHFDDRSEKNKKLWQKNTFNDGMPKISYNYFHQNNEGKLQVLCSIRDMGFCIIKDASY